MSSGGGMRQTKVWLAEGNDWRFYFDSHQLRVFLDLHPVSDFLFFFFFSYFIAVARSRKITRSC